MTLYINACVRSESRTNRLAGRLLEKLGNYTELYLPGEALQPLNEETLTLRTDLIASGDYSRPMFRYAKQFATADTIVIAAPYWDLSFPALLKTYIENIYVTGVVSRYGPDGQPIGLCRAKDLYYVTTAGGPFDRRFGFDYISDMAKICFGISNTHLIYAEMLDVEGFDAEMIVQTAMDAL